MPDDTTVVTTEKKLPVEGTTPPDVPPEGMKILPDGKVQVLHPSAYKRLKDEARAKGEKAALDKLAKDHGFNSIEEMQAALRTRQTTSQRQDMTNKNRHNGQQRRDPGPAPQNLSHKAAAAWEKERQKILGDLEKVKLENASMSRRNRQLKRQLEDTRLDMQLGRMATRVGVREVDFAVDQLKKHVDTLSEEEANVFSETDCEKFFTGLRESKPYLFGEVTKGATTGTTGAAAPQSGNGTPPAPKPADVNERGKTEPIDAMKLKPEEFRALLRKKGINPTM